MKSDRIGTCGLVGCFQLDTTDDGRRSDTIRRCCGGPEVEYREAGSHCPARHFVAPLNRDSRLKRRNLVVYTSLHLDQGAPPGSRERISLRQCGHRTELASIVAVAAVIHRHVNPRQGNCCRHFTRQWALARRVYRRDRVVILRPVGQPGVGIGRADVGRPRGESRQATAGIRVEVIRRCAVRRVPVYYYRTFARHCLDVRWSRRWRFRPRHAPTVFTAAGGERKHKRRYTKESKDARQSKYGIVRRHHVWRSPVREQLARQARAGAAVARVHHPSPRGQPLIFTKTLSAKSGSFAQLLVDVTPQIYHKRLFPRSSEPCGGNRARDGVAYRVFQPFESANKTRPALAKKLAWVIQ